MLIYRYKICKVNIKLILCIIFILINTKGCFNDCFTFFSSKNKKNKKKQINKLLISQNNIEINNSSKKNIIKINFEQEEPNLNEKIFEKYLNNEINRVKGINNLFGLSDKKIIPKFTFIYNIQNIKTINNLLNINNKNLKHTLSSIYLLTKNDNYIDQEIVNKISEPNFFSSNNSINNTFNDYINILEFLLNNNNNNNNNNYISIKKINSIENINQKENYSFSKEENASKKYFIDKNIYEFPQYNKNSLITSDTKDILLKLKNSLSLNANINNNNYHEVIKNNLIEILKKETNQNEINLNDILFCIQIELDSRDDTKYKIIKKIMPGYNINYELILL